MNNLIKDWINFSKTNQRIVEHRLTCKKKQTRKFCIECSGGGSTTGFVRSLEREIGDSEQRTERFILTSRLQATLHIPRRLWDEQDRDIISHIETLMLKGQSDIL